MKAVGIVRKLDPLGRITLPIEVRRNLDIQEEDPLEVFTEGDTIVLKKYAPACIFCGEVEGVTNILGKNICPECKKEIKKFKERGK